MIFIFLSVIASTAIATPSVWTCPLQPMGFVPGFDFRMGGEDCPAGSFVHYYSCCDDNPFQCCFHFETWAIVIFALLCIGFLAALLFFSGRLLMASRDV